MQKGKFRRPSSAPEARKERSCQSYSASHIKWRAERSFHRPTFIRPALTHELPRAFIWVVRGAIHFGKRERCAFWLNAMHSGKKWWIREFVPPYIFPLDPDMLLLAPYGRSTAINYGKWCPCSGIRSPLHFCSCSVSGSCSHSRSYSEFRFPAFPDAPPENKSEPKMVSETPEKPRKNMLKLTYPLGSPPQIETRLLFTFSSSLKISLDGWNTTEF